MGEIRVYIKCPACEKREEMAMPDDLDVQKGEEILILCTGCRYQLDGWIRGFFKYYGGSRGWGRHVACIFLELLCDEGNEHAMGLVKDMLDIKKTYGKCDSSGYSIHPQECKCLENTRG